ncbi:hypothetical protein XENOCAPTIV_016843 [Xenoophorus captivus]|uniref:Uncharacterized protein n=1 Tax=Xenoophorus captivus TaxID=1517983 RepID=A0ABV0RMS3_9TELE
MHVIKVVRCAGLGRLERLQFPLVDDQASRCGFVTCLPPNHKEKKTSGSAALALSSFCRSAASVTSSPSEGVQAVAPQTASSPLSPPSCAPIGCVYLGARCRCLLHLLQSRLDKAFTLGQVSRYCSGISP